jgi:hypothetical protein
MRHAKDDGVFESFENRRVNAEVVVALARRQLPVAFKQLQRRDGDAAIVKRFELKLLEIGRQSDSPVGFLGDEPQWRVKPRSPQKPDEFGPTQAGCHLRDIGIAGISDGFRRVQLPNLFRLRAIQLSGANFQRLATNELLRRIEFAGLKQHHQQERFQCGSRRFQATACHVHSMCGKDLRDVTSTTMKAPGNFPIARSTSRCSFDEFAESSEYSGKASGTSKNAIAGGGRFRPVGYAGLNCNACPVLGEARFPGQLPSCRY